MRIRTSERSLASGDESDTSPRQDRASARQLLICRELAALGVDGIEFESGGIERSSDPPKVFDVFFISWIGQGRQEGLVSTRAADVVRRTGILALETFRLGDQGTREVEDFRPDVDLHSHIGSYRYDHEKGGCVWARHATVKSIFITSLLATQIGRPFS